MTVYSKFNFTNLVGDVRVSRQLFCRNRRSLSGPTGISRTANWNVEYNYNIATTTTNTTRSDYDDDDDEPCAVRWGNGHLFYTNIKNFHPERPLRRNFAKIDLRNERH